MVAFPVDVVVNPAQAVTGARVVRRELDGINRSAQGLGQALSAGLAFAGITAGVQGLRQVTGFLANYQQAVSTVQAVTGSTTRETEALRTEFERLGESTRFSATQAAEGAIALGRAGFDTDEILTSLQDTLLLAQAGALDLGSAADISSNVLSGFRLEAEELSRVVDVLAFAANNTNTTVQTLGDGLRFVAPIAAALNISLEETVAVLGTLGDAGLQAGIAGRGLRGVLGSLVNPSDAAAEALANAGVNLAEIDVTAGDLTEVLRVLADSSLTVADAYTIFGDAGASVFEIIKEGNFTIEELEQALIEAGGSAQETADIMDDNLNGAILRAQSAFSIFVIELDNTTEFSNILKVSLDALAGSLNTVTAQLRDFNRIRDAVVAGITSTNLEQSTGTAILQNIGQGIIEDLTSGAIGAIEDVIDDSAGRREAEAALEAALQSSVAPSGGGSGGGGGGGGGRSAAAREAERAAAAAAREAERQAEINRRALERAQIRQQDLDFARQLLEAQFRENDSLIAQVQSEERIFRIQQERVRASEGVTDATTLALIQQNEEFAIATEQLRLERELQEILERQQETIAEAAQERLALLNELTRSDVNENLEETNSLTESLEGSFDGLGSAIRQAFEGGEDAMQNFFDSLIDRLLDQALQGLIDQLINVFTSGFGTGAGGLFSPISLGGGGPFTGFTSSFGGAFNPSSFSLGNIPILGSGGIATGPTLAMIGESGPEAVIPLDRFGGGNPAKQFITLTITDGEGNQQSTQVQSGADIEIEVDRIVSGLIRSPRSRTVEALRSNARGFT